MLFWLATNKEWLLSGAGIALPLAFIGWWLQIRSSPSSQSQRGGYNSVNVQIGGNLSFQSSETRDKVRLAQLSQFRQRIYGAAQAFDTHMEEATRCRNRGDVEGERFSVLQSARSCGEIITAYKLNTYLFDKQQSSEIDKEIMIAEAGGDEASNSLFSAVQLINNYSEAALDALARR